MAIISAKDFNKKLTSVKGAITKAHDGATELVHAASEYFLLGMRGDQTGYQNDQSQLQSIATVLDTHRAWSKGLGRALASAGISKHKTQGGEYKFSLNDGVDRQQAVNLIRSKTLAQWSKDESVESGFSLDAAKNTVAGGVATLIAAGLTLENIIALVQTAANDEKKVADKAKAIKAKQAKVAA